MATNPMHQFQVYKIGPEIKLGSFDLSFTNASLFMLISALSISLLLFFGSKNKNIIPNKIQLIAELIYNFISNYAMFCKILDCFCICDIKFDGYNPLCI